MKSYCFDTDDAVTYGVDEAIILHNLKYWISHNIANRKNLYDGRTWTYNSLPAFHEIFPFWSERQLDRILRSLLKSGVIVSGNYNKVGYDRTKWYALENEDSLKNPISPNGEIENTKRGDRKHRTVRPIPDINTDINTTKTIVRKPDERVKTAIDYLNMKTGHRFQSGKENTKILTSLLTEYKIEDLMAVIDSKTAEWMNTEHQKYLRPSTLFRRSKFIEYLGMAHVKQPDTRTGAEILMDNIGQNYERTDSTENNRLPAIGDERNLGQQVFPASTGSPAYHSAALDEDTSPFHS